MKTLFKHHTRPPGTPGWGLGGNRTPVAVLLLTLICILAFFLLGV